MKEDQTKEELREEVRQLRAQVAWQEQQLNETEQRYEHLVELLPDAVIVADMDGRILYANEASIQLMEVGAREELEGRSLEHFMRPEDRASAPQKLRRLRQGKRLEVEEHMVLRPDGHEVAVEVNAVPIRYEGQPAILSNIRDLTGRKAMQQALSDTQKLFYEAFHLGPAALTVSRLSDGAFIDVNEQFLELSGYDREEVISFSAADLGLWTDDRMSDHVQQDLQAHGALHDMEVPLHRKEGAIRTVLASARRIEVGDDACMLASMVDITEREQAEAAARESRTLLRQIFQATPAAISITRLSDGRFIDVNAEHCRLFEYERGEILGKTSREINMWPEAGDRSRFVQQLRDGGGSLHENEMRLRAKSGRVIAVMGSFQRISIGDEPCILAVVSDITKQKQAEQALREAKEHAEEMNQLKTTILENTTHEVRTPLTVILGFVPFLREGVRKEHERFVTLIERSGRRLLMMLDAILDLAQLEAGTLDVTSEPFDIVNVVRAVAEAQQPLAEEKNLSLNASLPSTPVYARLDHEVLRRVLNNLIDNAIKFTEEGSVDVTLESTKEAIRIVVRDTGVGISQAFQEKLFEEFVQESAGLERTHQGTGLGLTVTKRLVELVGGAIHVESEKGEGSAFTIHLPHAEDMDAAA